MALFTLTTCLTAQESGQQAGQARKTGWFVGVSPYFLGAEIKTTTENTTLTERYTKSPELWMLQTWHSLRAPPIK